MSGKAQPLNGVNTRPLSTHAIEVMKDIARRPVPRQEINPGVNARLETEGLTEVFRAASPYASHKGKLIDFIRLTDKGRARLEEIVVDT